MEKPFPYYSLNSNQPLNEDFHLEDEMLQNSKRNYTFSTDPDSNIAYQRYMQILIRVQNSLHRRFLPSRTLNIPASRSRISGGGFCKKSKKSEKVKKNSNKQCVDQPSCEAANPSKQTDCTTYDETSCPCNKSVSDKSPKSHCSSMPEPNESPCCVGHENKRRSCVSFQEPMATDIPIYDPHFRDCPCMEPDESCPPANNPCRGQDPHKDIPKTCPGEPPKVPVPKKKTESSRNHAGSRLCMRPIIVVPTGGSTKPLKKHQPKNSQVVSADHSKSQSAAHSHSYKSSSKHQGKSQLPEKSYSSKDSSANCCQPSVEIEETCSILSDTPSIEEFSQCQCTDPFCCFYLPEEPHCSTNPPACTNCPAICDLSKQLEEMNRRLEGLQSQELCDIRSQVNILNANVQSLANECIQKRDCANKLVTKASSTCQFCQGQCLNILDSFHRQLMDSIRDRCLTDIVITLFLRADNVYHVNVRDLCSGCSLGCYLVTDAAIEEAMELGVFQEILTFSVIDVRNTIKSKNCALGISFEFHHASRQCGGCDSPLRGTCMAGKEYMARILGLPIQQLEYVYSVPQTYAKNTENNSRKPSRHLGVEFRRIQSHSVSTQTKSTCIKATKEIINLDADRLGLERGTRSYIRSTRPQGIPAVRNQKMLL
ncbi:uncharacterized protein LOC6526857 [Drosophila yakuba]|uniref:Uncharacterized protein n=1 Tax=Drosophila yakuba TaxID=7245 RepID=B4NZ05_DROYA|nr:uncharacterized protein LOC6526857 [Drosophila yakuba]EDW87669.2 uncharacterized protein Dyak_GE14685 [Drosophila yakuba]